MLFEYLEARRLMSVVAGNPASLQGVTVTQAGDGSLTIKGADSGATFSVIEAGTRNDTGGIIASTGSGNVAVIDQFGDEVIYGGVNLTKAVTIQTGKGGGSVLFDGNLHKAAISGGSQGTTDITLIDEGQGGSTLNLGKAANNVNVPFSHHLTITDGGGDNNIILNSDFSQDSNPDASTNGATATADNHNPNSPGSESVNVNGNQTADLITVTINGSGANLITDYAGNLKIKTGSGFDTLYVQSTSPNVVINTPPQSFQTAWIDVISDQGINQIDTIQTT